MMDRHDDTRRTAQEQRNETEQETQEQTTQRRTGRPTDCTPELAEAMREALEQHGFLGLACDLVGIGRSTAYEWIARGEEDMAVGRDTPFALFADAVKKGRAAFQVQSARMIAEGRQGWQSRAWMLERSDPEQYAVRNRVEHSGRVETGTAPVLTPSEWEDRRARILGDHGPN